MALDARRSGLRTRLITSAVLSLLVLSVLTGCTSGSGLGGGGHNGAADVQFDGLWLGNGISGIVKAYPRITCTREPDTGALSLIERHDVTDDDWRVRGDGPKASLRLEMTPGRESAASVEFSIRSAVYASDTPTRLEPSWGDGRAVFRDIPLVDGEPFKGKSRLKRLVVTWFCYEDQPDE